ncbi:MAG: hypothetical protein Rubg2KO_17930 [Rubricoccaceae bacterium]
MLQTILVGQVAAVLILAGCGSTGLEATPDDDAPPYEAFSSPERVEIHGYPGDAMEPFLSRDGRYLFFNNRNDPSINTDLHVAELVTPLTFEYLGPLAQVNTASLEGVPTMDRFGTFYFVSPRSYEETLSTLYQGHFADGAISDIQLVPGVSRETPGIVNFDIEVSPDGGTLYFVDARFGALGPETADLVMASRRGNRFERIAESDEILRHVNTRALEYAAAISADGLELFFNRVESVREGASPKIYRAVRRSLDAPFDAPQRVAAMEGFVEGATFSPDGHAVYYHKREDGRFVLYRVAR